VDAQMQTCPIRSICNIVAAHQHPFIPDKNRRTAMGFDFLENGPLPTRDVCDIVASFNRSFKGVSRLTLVGHTRVVTALAVLPDYKIASGSWDKTVRVWDAANGECLYTLYGHTDGVVKLAALSEGKLASGSYDGTVRVWQNDACLRTLDGHHPSRVNALAGLSDNKLASARLDGVVFVWHTVTGEKLLRLTHQYPVVAFAEMPDGKLVSASTFFITVWDVQNGECLRTLETHAGLSALLVLPNGNYLIAYRDDTIRVCNPTSLECLVTHQASCDIHALVHLPDGEIAASSREHVSIWDAERMATIRDYPCSGHGLAALPCGGIVTGAQGENDFNVHVWW